MKVSRDLKELLRRKLQKKRDEKIKQKEEILNKKFKIQSEKIKKMSNQISKIMSERRKLKDSISEKIDGYVSDNGAISYYDNELKISFDVDEKLWVFIENIEVSNDEKGVLKEILNEINGM